MNNKFSKLDANAVGVRLTLCAAAVAGAAGTAPQAHAAVITFNTTIVVPQTNAGVYINLLTGATGSSGAALSGWDFNPYLAGGGSTIGFYWGRTPPSTSGCVSVASLCADLTPGTVISGASSFTDSILATDNFRSPGVHTLGFRFYNENTLAINYGFMSIEVGTGGVPGFPATIRGWSFEDTGASITTPGGDIPEPSSVALTGAALALGAVALRRRRRPASQQ